MKKFLSLFLFFPLILWSGPVQLGIDRFFNENQAKIVEKKRVGLITNHTGVDSHLRSTIDLFKEKTQLVAIFSPEHGILGSEYAAKIIIKDKEDKDQIPIFSLHGEHKRPTPDMLRGVDILVYDIQEIGCRSYTYISTLFYVMEEAAKLQIPVVVLDRPNPMGGIIVDGPMLKEPWRSFLGYIDVPYCHGMTVGELARFFNVEYKIGCPLHIIPMSGWKRSMIFKETGLPWIPTSPYIPESDTPFFYASTGILGSLGIVSIGIGYTLPFKVVGAPWINGPDFAAKLNAQGLAGVKFLPFYYRPFYGRFKGEDCQGVKIMITDPAVYKPVSVQYMVIGILKSLYPKYFEEKFKQITPLEKSSFCKVNGNEEIFELIKNEKYIAWKLISFDESRRKAFLKTRERYLLYD